MVRVSVALSLCSIYPVGAERERVVLLGSQGRVGSGTTQLKYVVHRNTQSKHQATAITVPFSSSTWQLLSGPDVVLSKKEMLFSGAGDIYYFSDINA